MKLKRYRYQNPEPGDTGTGPATPTPAEAPSAPLANHPEPAPAQPAAAAPDAPATTTTTDPDNEAKIGALLDAIGKDVAPTPGTKPLEGASKPSDGATDGQKSASEPAKPALPVDPKALDLTPPEGITERSKTRWTALADQAKLVPDLERRATEAEAALTGVRELVAQSGLQPDEFQGMLQMGRLFKSADQGELRQALEQLDGLRADLATRLGVDAPGVDVLAQHADLKAKVDNMTLSREDALEIVRLRGTAAQANQATAATQEMQQFQQTVRAAATEMDATLAARAATPGHAEKVAFIKSQLADPKRIQEFVTTYQPHQWKAAVLMMYDAYTPPAPASAVPNTPQPLRPGHVSAGTRVPNGKPVSSADAVANAFDAIGL